VSWTVTLDPWGRGDLPLLERLIGDSGMTEHLGGPESSDKLRGRQGRYERLEGATACSGSSTWRAAPACRD